MSLARREIGFGFTLKGGGISNLKNGVWKSWSTDVSGLYLDTIHENYHLSFDSGSTLSLRIEGCS